MRNFLIFLLFFIHKNTFCQLHDNFDDGDFTHNPEWIASNNNEDFIINNNRELQSNSTVVNSDFYISTTNTKALNCIWEFDCNLKFATSGSNFTDVYIISNTDNLQHNNINGYFVRIGNTDDEVSLYKRDGTLSSITKLIDGENGTVNSSGNNAFRIRVTRTFDGEFTLEWDKSRTGSDYQTEGKVIDNTFLTSNYFGIYIKQSATSFHRKHFFDNFTIKDITPPKLISSTIENNQITLTFDKIIDTEKANNPHNYLLNPHNIHPVSVTPNNNLIILNFTHDFESGDYALTIQNIEDLNIKDPVVHNFNYTKPYFAKPKDIVINEIFADPSPQIDLPATEFIELWNTTAQRISLKGFTYSDLTSFYTFGNEWIEPHEYLILCARSDTAEYKKYGRVIGISPWISLNNTSDLLTLSNAEGMVIHSVNYTDNWYKDATKKKGGYTLELINPASSCISSQNYTASNDVNGGTPGKQNSVYLSNQTGIPLHLLAAALKDSITLIVHFNRSIDSLQAANTVLYSINNTENPVVVKVNAPDFSSVELQYPSAFIRNKTYTLTINTICDCEKNILKNIKTNFIYPAEIEKKNILINEILFNPRPGGYDFVEVYNNSDNTLDFKDLFLATTNDKDDIINIKTITDTSILFKPKSYWVLTADPENIKTNYYTSAPDNFIKMNSLPAFNDDEGAVVLLNKKHERIDQLNYNKKMHFSLLKDTEGVSLERSFLNEETNKPGNFRSATSSVGYATPAYKNSQYIDIENYTESSEDIALSTKVFSPDNDGFKDILNIHYNVNFSDAVANVKIYGDNGKLYKKLINNQLVSNKGNWVWDGTDENNNRVQSGIYILYIEFFDLNGNVKKHKDVVSVAYRN